MKFFMITLSFGLTVRVLQHRHLRLLRGHVTFAGKAFVAHA